VFDAQGTITAGNSSGLNDGAAAVLVMSEARMNELGLTPLARIASYASAGVEPMDMGLGPVAASRLALEKAGWRAADLDVLEVNEAFAAQAIAVNREMGWNEERINISGGAIALGHPLAGSGCRIVVTLLHEMMRRKASKGLASLCIGGGQGVSICLER
jgi:acetyl-CoA C-acetyltransferase